MPTQQGDRLRTPPRGHVRIQSNKADYQSSTGYRVTVPSAVARLVGPDRLFRVELTDEGILLRYVDGGEAVEPLPAWLTD